jgi:hypothetical protein
MKMEVGESDFSSAVTLDSLIKPSGVRASGERVVASK